MDDSAVDRIFRGSFVGLPRLRPPLFRVYTSSTYTDMQVEKAVLVDKVYPALKEYCRERHGMEFQVR